MIDISGSVITCRVETRQNFSFNFKGILMEGHTSFGGQSAQGQGCITLIQSFK